MITIEIIRKLPLMKEKGELPKDWEKELNRYLRIKLQICKKFNREFDWEQYYEAKVIKKWMKSF
ncbi:MAG: hypothetical protein QW156_04410 [Candidatus Aenigmatarchaeota archaeon]